MPEALDIKGTIIANIPLSPTVNSLIFRADRLVNFQPGQFLSAIVPLSEGKEVIKRIYSFANQPSAGDYELCVKNTGGPGSSYMCGLKEGDAFRARAPYGHFVLRPSDRDICFIGTGTGVAPLRAMLLSKQLQELRPGNVTAILGFANREEILYRRDFEQAGASTLIALSREKAGISDCFGGRVTDYLASLPLHWPWHTTDFYLCGNGNMIRDVVHMLRSGHGIAPSAIHCEAYFERGDHPSAPATPIAA